LYDSPELPTHVSPAAARLIKAFMAQEPAERLTAADGLVHPWFAKDQGAAEWPSMEP